MAVGAMGIPRGPMTLLVVVKSAGEGILTDKSGLDRADASIGERRKFAKRWARSFMLFTDAAL